MRDIFDAMATIIATNVRTLRDSMNLKQEEFGDVIGVSQGTVARWEKGMVPKHDAIQALADLASVTPLEFTKRLLSEVGTPSVDQVSGPSAGSVLLPVSLPSEDAMAAMFQGLLGIVDAEQDRALAARLLARLLPGALGQTVFRASDSSDPAVETAPVPSVPARSTANPATRQ